MTALATRIYELAVAPPDRRVFTRKFGARLYALRFDIRLSQADVARGLGVSRATYIRWEQGVATPSAMYLPRLASLFGVTLDALFDFRPQRLDDALVARVRGAAS